LLHKKIHEQHKRLLLVLQYSDENRKKKKHMVVINEKKFAITFEIENIFRQNHEHTYSIFFVQADSG